MTLPRCCGADLSENDRMGAGFVCPSCGTLVREGDDGIAAAARASAGRFEVGDVLETSWTIFKAQMGTVMGVVLIAALINGGVGQVIAAIAKDAPPSNVVAVFALGELVGMILSVWLGLGQTKVLLDVARRGSGSIGDLFKGGEWLASGVGATLLITLIMAGVIGVCFGIPFFIGVQTGSAQGDTIGTVVGIALATVPAMILALMFCMIQPLIVDRDLGPVDALKTSRAIMDGNKAQMFLLWLAMIAINLAGMLVACVGLLFTLPLTILAFIVAYLSITGQRIHRPLRR